MRAGSYNIFVQAGTRFERILTWKPSEVGVPYDLTGWTARMQVRSRTDDSLLLPEFNTDVGGGITLGGVAGTIQLVIPSATTMQNPNLFGVYQLELVQPDGEPVRLLAGTFQIDKEVTV
jgi:hypothetical protein